MDISDFILKHLESKYFEYFYFISEFSNSEIINDQIELSSRFMVIFSEKFKNISYFYKKYKRKNKIIFNIEKNVYRVNIKEFTRFIKKQCNTEFIVFLFEYCIMVQKHQRIVLNDTVSKLEKIFQ